MQSASIPQNMRRADAARYIRETHGIPCAPATLAKYAVLGGGPAFRKAGKFPIYSRDELDAWAERRFGELVQSTSALSVHGHQPRRRRARAVVPRHKPSIANPRPKRQSAEAQLEHPFDAPDKSSD
jgi:hypothetical protein